MAVVGSWPTLGDIGLKMDAKAIAPENRAVKTKKKTERKKKSIQRRCHTYDHHRSEAVFPSGTTEKDSKLF